MNELGSIVVCFNLAFREKFSSLRDKDPKDDVVLNTAYDGKAEYIVSGDHHLQNLKRFKGIKIVSPKQMVKIIARRFSEFII